MGVHTYGLDELAGAVRYRRYLCSLISSFCGPSILEVGSGTGEFIQQLDDGRRLIATDVDQHCLDVLARLSSERASITVERLDITEPIAGGTRVSTVIALNVLEHIEDDVQALKNLSSIIEPGGTLVLFVPAHERLYGPFDAAVGHVRRYEKAMLRAAVENAGYDIVKLHHVNLIGGIAWWLGVRIGRRSRPSAHIVRIYDRLLVPVVRLMERWWHPPFGQSLLCVARPRTRQHFA